MDMVTVLIPGGFKPPHVGHYKFFMHYINNPEVSEVRIFCGERQRKVGDDFSVSIEQAEAVLRLYGILDNPKVVYQRAKVRKGQNGHYTNPFADVYDWAEENHDKTENQISLGLSSKDTGYQAGFLGYFKSFANIVEIQHTYEQEHLVSATEFRGALAAGNSIKKFIPEHVEEEEIIKIFS
jgi:nicotinic acid mononucleotide adenylyltransferase